MNSAVSSHFTIRKGPRLSERGAPNQIIEADFFTARAAILGVNYPNLRSKFCVKLGDQVSQGQTVFTDRRHPEVTFASPISGTIAGAEYGPRRILSSLIVEHNRSEDNFTITTNSTITDTTGTTIRTGLLSSGMWPMFIARPFGRIPAPDAVPSAIFVNATQSSKLAPDPRVVLEGQEDTFGYGIRLLKRLMDGPVYVCQRPCNRYFSDTVQGIETHFFQGLYAAGLSGTHINRLHKSGPKHQVWTIGYQDVLAIGHLFETGQYLAKRVISIVGSAIPHPILVRTNIGANLSEVIEKNRTSKPLNKPIEIYSGDDVSGFVSEFLGSRHQQVTITERQIPKNYSKLLSVLTSASSALVPTAALEKALALDILPIPLMRALNVGDTEAALRLGCLELLEEDVSALSKFCASDVNYGVLLRLVLDKLAEDMA
jgi:Na+-transporting NADH:ubiquinone oxidoreductase subunit A